MVVENGLVPLLCHVICLFSTWDFWTKLVMNATISTCLNQPMRGLLLCTGRRSEWMSVECVHVDDVFVRRPNSCTKLSWEASIAEVVQEFICMLVLASRCRCAIRRSHVTLVLFLLFCTRHPESKARVWQRFVVLGFCMWGDVGLGFGRGLHYWMTMTTLQLCMTAAWHPIRPLEVTEWPEFE